jgi:hypothetical protein
MKSPIAGDIGIDPEENSQISFYSPKSHQGTGRLWSIKKVHAIRNSGSVEKLFQNGMGVESVLKVSQSVPKIQINGNQKKANFERDLSMRQGTIKGCIDPSSIDI